MDCGLPGSSIHGIFQARIPEWVAISFSRGPSQPRDQTQVSCTTGRLFTIWATREAPRPGANPRPSAWGVWSLSHRSTEKSLLCYFLIYHFLFSSFVPVDQVTIKLPCSYSVKLCSLTYPLCCPYQIYYYMLYMCVCVCVCVCVCIKCILYNAVCYWSNNTIIYIQYLFKSAEKGQYIFISTDFYNDTITSAITGVCVCICVCIQNTIWIYLLSPEELHLMFIVSYVCSQFSSVLLIWECLCFALHIWKIV